MGSQPDIPAPSMTPGTPAFGDLPGFDSPRSVDASVAPPPLTEGILRVKVPAAKIEPFLARTGLFAKCGKDVIAKVAALMQGLECAEGSEVLSQGKVNDGL